MKKDLDRLMKKMKVDAIYAEGHASRDSDMYYLLNGANIFAHYIKKRGRRAYVLHTPIEREVAEQTGHRLVNLNKYDREKFLKKYQDLHKVNAAFVSTILDDLGVKGRMIFYGQLQMGAAYRYIKQILRFNRGLELYEGNEGGLITRARMTKGDDEIARIRRVRDGVVHAFNAMLRGARTYKVKGDFLIRGDRSRVLLGDLRRALRSELFNHGIVDSGGMIVAQGRDAGVPHNSGRDRQPVRLGEPIVIDIFPQEVGGGYFFDFTRTICFGFAPKHVKTLYKTVCCARDYALSELRIGARTRDIEVKICKYFEAKGHKTFLSDPKTQVGYCHSLGHGIGLDVHEAPFFNLYTANKYRIEPNMVFTVEPGLYYPDKGYGVRIEDVVYVNRKGKAVNLTKYPSKLVIPI